MGLTKAEKLHREALRLAGQIREQREWIDKCGGDLAGYVARYGDSNAPYGKSVAEGGRYGNGGQAIYEADMSTLDQLLEAYLDVTGVEYPAMNANQAERLRELIPAFIATDDAFTEHLADAHDADSGDVTVCGIAYESLPDNVYDGVPVPGDKPWYYDHDRDDVVRCEAGCFAGRTDADGEPREYISQRYEHGDGTADLAYSDVSLSLDELRLIRDLASENLNAIFVALDGETRDSLSKQIAIAESVIDKVSRSIGDLEPAE
jgi:hypothetical protein